MRRLVIIVIGFATLAMPLKAQVDEIKKASGNQKSPAGDGRGSSNPSGSYIAIELANFAVHALVEWQQAKLNARNQNPEVVSLEVMAFAAIQPSSYYIIHPRVRGNWGLFSTDFRMNYVIEEGADGIKHLRTDDWQILELNIVTQPRANFYIGWGFLHEAFNDNVYYNEWTTCLRGKPFPSDFSLLFEYRHSDPRIEANFQVHYPLVKKTRLSILVTGGGAFQQYYSTIKVWGLQGGLICRLY
jgi:hypothetical protein